MCKLLLTTVQIYHWWTSEVIRMPKSQADGPLQLISTYAVEGTGKVDATRPGRHHTHP